MEEHEALSATARLFGNVEPSKNTFGPGAKAGVTDSLAALAIPLRDLLVFAGLAATALYFRRHSDIHKRLMVLATINLLPPARGRVHWIYWLGGCVTIVSVLVQFTLGRTEAWHHFASWLIRETPLG